MSHLFELLLLLLLSTISSVSVSDVFDNGRQKYEQIQLLSASASTTSSCWHRVLSMLHEHCSTDELAKYQSSIAYQFTLCHLSTMTDDLAAVQCTENNIDRCVERLHQHTNAFIAYTEFYPFVQSVCYVLRQKSYQSELTTRLTLFLENSEETIAKLASSIHLQQQLTDKMKHQQYIQETILNNALKLKRLAQTNMDKTQDILSNVIEAARHEYDLLKQICALSQTIQTIVRITCTYSFWFYALSMCAIYIITIPKRTNRARLISQSIERSLSSMKSIGKDVALLYKSCFTDCTACEAGLNADESLLFAGMFAYVLLERYFQMSTIINCYHWRLICWTCCLLLLLRFASKYQSRTEMHNEQLCRITTNLVQTEATFQRVSRELKRARSRSRSRSRSMRSRQRQEKLTSPLVQDSTDENKENACPSAAAATPVQSSQSNLIDEEDDPSLVNGSKPRHYSLIISQKQPTSSKPVRILLGSRQISNNTEL